MNKIALEFFKNIEEMIELEATCSEILEKINEHPEEIKSLIDKEFKKSLISGKDKILKDQLTEIKPGFGKRLEDAARLEDSDPINPLSRFKSFIERKIKELEK